MTASFSHIQIFSNFSLGDNSKPMIKLSGCHNSNLMRKQQSTFSGCLSKFESGTLHRAHKAHRRQRNNANTQTLHGLTFVAPRCPHSENKIQPKRKWDQLKAQQDVTAGEPHGQAKAKHATPKHTEIACPLHFSI